MDKDNEILKRAINLAVMAAAERLFRETGESFYYFTLITSGEGHAPIVSAWSREQLALVPEDERKWVKWSYADSPYFDFDADGFNEVKRLFERRPNIFSLSGTLRQSEYEERLSLMEAALAQADDAGVFGRGSVREDIVINVEVMPPDKTNTERAMRLNPSKALKDWMLEAAESDDPKG